MKQCKDELQSMWDQMSNGFGTYCTHDDDHYMIYFDGDGGGYLKEKNLINWANNELAIQVVYTPNSDYASCYLIAMAILFFFFSFILNGKKGTLSTHTHTHTHTHIHTYMHTHVACIKKIKKEWRRRGTVTGQSRNPSALQRSGWLDVASVNGSGVPTSFWFPLLWRAFPHRPVAGDLNHLPFPLLSAADRITSADGNIVWQVTWLSAVAKDVRLYLSRGSHISLPLFNVNFWFFFVSRVEGWPNGNWTSLFSL